MNYYWKEKESEKTKNKNRYLKRFFFKLINNSVFGKTVENLRKQVDTKLVTTK